MSSSLLADAVRGRAEAMRGALADAHRVQIERLHGLVTDNAATEFGREHRFGELAALAERARDGGETDARRFVDAWQRRVPVAAPEAFAPRIARAAAGLPDVLFAGRAVALEATGGSTTGTRLIAYSANSLVEFQQAALPWLDDLFVHEPALRTRKAYWAISPIGARKAGAAAVPRPVPLGMNDAAYLGEAAGAGLVASLAVPPAVGAIDARGTDHTSTADGANAAGGAPGQMRDWQRITLVHLLACRSLGLVSVWSPSFLSVLLQLLDDEGDRLIDAVRRGPAALGVDLARIPAAALQWPRCASRADELLDCRPDGAGFGRAAPGLDLARVWPQLRLVSCWADAGSAAAAAALARRLPQARVQGKGLLATEGAVTLPLSPWPDPVLAIGSGFFEFVDAAGVARLGAELRAGDRYRVVLSNASGLYRYRLGDVVECTGMAAGAPMLRFVGRGDHVVDLVGEKLDDAFVADCLARVPDGAWPSGCRPAAAILAAVDAPGRSRYRLLVEAPSPDARTDGARSDGARDGGARDGGARSERARAEAALATALDDALAGNPQYAYARRLGQLGAPQVQPVPDLTRRWIAQRLAAGQSPGDVKLPSLCSAYDGDRIVPAVAGARDEGAR